MYNQMANQQQCLITSPILQVIKSSWQHITHTFKLLKEGEQILELLHVSKQNQLLWNDPFWKLTLWLPCMNKSNGQAHKHLSHCSNKIKISVRHQAWCRGSSMSHSQIDRFLNWLHFIFFRPQLGGEVDSLWDECILEKMAETDLLSLPYTTAISPAAAGSPPQSPKIPISILFF